MNTIENNNSNDKKLKFPLLDKKYFYDKIMKKEEKERKFYEKFYIWSIKNRSTILFNLLIIAIITYILEISYYTSNDKCNNEMQGGKGGKTTISGNKQKGNFMQQARDNYLFFPLIDKLFINIWAFIKYTKVGFVIAMIYFIYGFGIVVIPLIILFFIIKYSLKMYRVKSKPLADLYKSKNNKNNKNRK